MTATNRAPFTHSRVGIASDPLGGVSRRILSRSRQKDRG
jgi:hypothetical protein